RRRSVRLVSAGEARRPPADRDRARHRLPVAMSRISIRLRSVAAATLGILLAVVIVGAGVDVLVSRHLHRSFDRTLHARAVEVAQLAASAPAVLTTPGALDSPLGGTQLSVEVVDRRGRIVARSLSLGGRVLPARRLLQEAIANGRSGSSRGLRRGSSARAIRAAGSRSPRRATRWERSRRR